VWLDAAPPAPDRLAMIEEFLTGDEGSYDSVMVDGQIVWDSVSSYLPTPLEVLRNPWIQWMVLMPRDISGAEYDLIRAIVPTALRALGLRTGLTHLEWFRRPDGSVAVSEVAVRPPGGQITSMLCYVHDFDLYSAWAQLMVHGSFAPPQRSWSAGTAARFSAPSDAGSEATQSTTSALHTYGPAGSRAATSHARDDRPVDDATVGITPVGRCGRGERPRGSRAAGRARCARSNSAW